MQGYLADGASVTVSGNVSIAAKGIVEASASTTGVSAGTIGVGVSLASATASPNVTASAGSPGGSGSVTITAGSLTINANTQLPGSGFSALATATGSSGGLIGVDATVTSATGNAQVHSFVGNGSTLNIAGGATNVLATSSSKQKADSNSNVGGIIAAGISRSNASSTTTTEAYLGNNVKLTGRSLNITASGVDDNFADTTSGSAGLIAGNSAKAETHNTSTTTAEIRSRTGDTSRTIDVSTSGGTGTLNMTAEHVAKFNARVQTFAGGLLAGTGAGIDNFMTGNVTTAIGDNAIALGKNIVIEAINHVSKPSLATPNIDGTTGGLISGGGADSDTQLN